MDIKIYSISKSCQIDNVLDNIALYLSDIIPKNHVMYVRLLSIDMIRQFYRYI